MFAQYREEAEGTRLLFSAQRSVLERLVSAQNDVLLEMQEGFAVMMVSLQNIERAQQQAPGRRASGARIIFDYIYGVVLEGLIYGVVAFLIVLFTDAPNAQYYIRSSPTWFS